MLCPREVPIRSVYNREEVHFVKNDPVKINDPVSQKQTNKYNKHSHVHTGGVECGPVTRVAMLPKMSYFQQKIIRHAKKQ